MHIGKTIFSQCIQSFLADKLVILVTHQVQYIKENSQIDVHTMKHGTLTTEFGQVDDNLQEEEVLEDYAHEKLDPDEIKRYKRLFYGVSVIYIFYTIFSLFSEAPLVRIW